MEKLRVRLPQELLDRVRGYSLLHHVPLLRFIDTAIATWNAKNVADEEWLISAALPVSSDVRMATRDTAKVLGLSLQTAVRRALEEYLESLMTTHAPAEPVKIETIQPESMPSTEVTCYRCGNKWTPRKAEPSYCPRCRASDWNDAWKCKTCGEWYPKKLQRGEFCMKHQIQPGAPAARVVAPAEMDEPENCGQCETPFTSTANYPFCSAECMTAWKEENQ